MDRPLHTAAALDWEPRRPQRRKDPPLTRGEKILAAIGLLIFVAALLFAGRCDYLDQEAIRATIAREAAQ
jgi:hypothetical protein